jgi:hypothetical protein
VTDRHERANQGLLPHRLTPGQHVLTEDREQQGPGGRRAYRSSAELVVGESGGYRHVWWLSVSEPDSPESRMASKYVLHVRQRAWQVMI